MLKNWPRADKYQIAKKQPETLGLFIKFTTLLFHIISATKGKAVPKVQNAIWLLTFRTIFIMVVVFL